MLHLKRDPQHWRDRAEEMRTLAEDMHEGPRAVALRIAADYEELAHRALTELQQTLHQENIYENARLRGGS